MRTPRNALGTALLCACVSALICVFGGPGGAWIALRDVRRRVDSHDDDLESLRQRMQRREGQAGNAVARERKGNLDAEISAILNRPKNNGHKEPEDEASGFPDWARGVFR